MNNASSRNAQRIVLRVNGYERGVTIAPRVTLLDALREYLHLYGTKKGCDLGQCGACTVHVNGRRVLSCLSLAVQAQSYAVGAFAPECAMDELAHELGLDPIELRLRNWAERDPHTGKPWSTRKLREAYQAGADAFGWRDRLPQPRSMRRGSEWIGWGMAGGAFPVYTEPACVRILCAAPDGQITGGVDR